MTVAQNGVSRLLIFITIASLTFGFGRDLIRTGHSYINRDDVERMIAQSVVQSDREQAKSDAYLMIRLSRIEDQQSKMYDILLQMQRDARRSR